MTSKKTKKRAAEGGGASPDLSTHTACHPRFTCRFPALRLVIHSGHTLEALRIFYILRGIREHTSAYS